MKKNISFGIAGLVATSMAYGSAVNLIESYRNAGAGPFSPDAGGSAWTGDDASLEEIQATEIRGYLLANAADRARLSRARAFSAGSDTGDVLPRITNTRYFQREHSEIPERVARDNAELGSFSNCQACHSTADAGIYNEHQVVIPGVGKWDD